MGGLKFSENNKKVSVMERDYYVYAWFCEDWGHIPFYVGKGKGSRYKNTGGRGIQFSAVIQLFKCYPLQLVVNLTETKALAVEEQVKLKFAQSGFPVIDMENGTLKKKLTNDRIKIAQEKGVKWGRPKLDVPDFHKILKKQKEGLITVNEAVKKLGISRSSWYNLVKDVQNVI